MQAFDRMSAEICEEGFADERATLVRLNKFYADSKLGFSDLALQTVCGHSMNDCFSAFSTVATNFPACLEKMISASVFEHAASGLKIAGDMD